MKKLVSLILVIICLFTLTGCKKDEISVKKFKDEMVSRGFKLYDSNTLGKQYNVKGAILASSSFETYQVELYEFDSKKSAKESFEKQKENIDSLYDNVETTNENKSNYSKATFKTDNKVIIMYRVDNIYLLAQGANTDETFMIEVLEKMGY